MFFFLFFVCCFFIFPTHTPNPTRDPTPNTPTPQHPTHHPTRWWCGTTAGGEERRTTTEGRRGVNSRPGREEVANLLLKGREEANAQPEEVECEQPPKESEGKPPPKGEGGGEPPFPMPMQIPSNVSAPMLISVDLSNVLAPVLRLRLRLNVIEMALSSPQKKQSRQNPPRETLVSKKPTSKTQSQKKKKKPVRKNVAQKSCSRDTPISKKCVCAIPRSSRLGVLEVFFFFFETGFFRDRGFSRWCLPDWGVS